jgi:hypothetical protein
MNHWLLSQQVRRIAILGAAIVCFSQFAKDTKAPVRMPELLAVSTVVPNAVDGRLGQTLRTAAAWDFDLLQQFFLYLTYSSGKAAPIAGLRVWYGLAAVLAVIWIARVGRILAGTTVGIVAAYILANLTPMLWGMHALRIWVLLLHFELLIAAVRRPQLVRWGVWGIVTLLLFCGGVFAEPFLLQTWFLCLLLSCWWWRLASRRLPLRRQDQHEAAQRKRQRRNTPWHRLRYDSGMMRFMLLLIAVSGVGIVLTIIGVLFFSHLAVSLRTVMGVLVVSMIISLASGCGLLLLPVFRHERELLSGAVMEMIVADTRMRPEVVFQPIHNIAFLHGLLAYAVAMVLFLPVVYLIAGDLNVFVTYNQLNVLTAFLVREGWLAWLSAAIPLLFALGVVVRYALGRTSRARCIGAVIVLLCSTVYAVQQRYAVFATPFYCIGAAGVICMLGESIYMLYMAVMARLKPAPAADKREA